jgi:hypothetical protein
MSEHAKEGCLRADILKIVPQIAAAERAYVCLGIHSDRYASAEHSKVSARRCQSRENHDENKGSLQYRWQLAERTAVQLKHRVNTASCQAYGGATGSNAARPGVFFVVFPAFCPFQLRIHPQTKLGSDGL